VQVLPRRELRPVLQVWRLRDLPARPWRKARGGRLSSSHPPRAVDARRRRLSGIVSSMKPLDLRGRTFDRLRVLGSGAPASSGKTTWRCECSCGSCARDYRTNQLRNGKTRSCGCLRSETSPKNGFQPTHGMSRLRDGKPSAEWLAWKNMRDRCLNPKADSYRHYGERGIAVSPLWIGEGGFERFLAEVGPRPSSRYSLDRIKNDRGYEPGNVRWATRHEQAMNKRTTLFVTIEGETKPLYEWCEARELDYHLVWDRIARYGWNPSVALHRPANKYARRRSTRKEA
jgi:hypothetical protein